MITRIKFCGLTRAQDAEAAARLGASYAGVIFAPSPRRVSASDAATVFEGAETLTRVGVFATAEPTEISDAARIARLDVAQLHGDPTAPQIDAVRQAFGGEVWAVARVRGGVLPANVASLLDAADALVLDAWSSTRLGGTGERFAWADVARVLAPMRRASRARLVLAGGLNPENVTEAVDTFAPDVVDVSSGVECAPGAKDHERMRAFAEAVRELAAHGSAGRNAETR